jgi:hypothetical protein
MKSDGWVIRNMRDLYNSLVPEECVKILGGMENTRRTIAYAGGWPEENITIRQGSESTWGAAEAKHVFIAERTR